MRPPPKTTAKPVKLIQLFLDEVPHDLHPNVHSDALRTKSNISVGSLAKFYRNSRKALLKALLHDAPQDLQFEKPTTRPTKKPCVRKYVPLSRFKRFDLEPEAQRLYEAAERLELATMNETWFNPYDATGEHLGDERWTYLLENNTAPSQ